MSNEETHINRFAKIIPHLLKDDGVFPNSIFPLLVYKNVFELGEGNHPQTIEKIFETNHWNNTWRDGIFNYHHYHSNTHEVLGIYSGTCRVLMGGDDGVEFDIEKGDAIIIPAGVAHKNMSNSQDFKCIGAYPAGHDFDMNYGRQSERPLTDHHIAHVQMPANDPVFGKDGGLFNSWIKTVQ